MIHIPTENRIDILRETALLQEREIRNLNKRIEDLVRELAVLKGLPWAVSKQEVLFELDSTSKKPSQEKEASLGQGSERRPRSDSATETPTPKAPRQKTGPTPQPLLPTVDNVLTLDDADKICPDCGAELKEIEGQFEISETIVIERVQYSIRKDMQQKYRCINPVCQHIETALPADDKLRGSRYSLPLVIDVAMDKYEYHQPLNRQVKKMAQFGLKVTTQTLYGLLSALAVLLEPTWEALRKLILSQEIAGADETRWRLMDGKSESKFYIFILSSLKGLYYTFKASKSAEMAAEVIGNFTGWLIVDGASTYTSLYERLQHEFATLQRDGPGFKIASCWAHCRRRFFKAWKDFPEAGRMLDLVAMLYRVVNAAKLDPTMDPTIRRMWVEAIIQEMERWKKEMAGRLIPGTSLEKAINYANNYWERLTHVVDHPEVWLDNNISERGLRQPVIGRKNHYGSHSVEGMKVAAIFYSLIETCEMLGVDPRAYLLEAAKRAMANPGSVYLPHEMIA